MDTKDDPTFLGNAQGICLFAQHAAEAQAKAGDASQALSDALVAAAQQTSTASSSATATAAAEAAAEAAATAAGAVGDIRMLDSMAWLLKDEEVLSDFQRSLEAE